MADKDSNLNESGIKDNTSSQNVSEEALLFDEATVLSRQEEGEQEDTNRIDTSELMGNTQESGNENIQTVIPEEINGERSGFVEGAIRDEALADQLEQTDIETVTSTRDELEPSDGAQAGIQEPITPVRDTQSDPQGINIDSPGGTSEAAIDDLVIPLDSGTSTPVPTDQNDDPEPRPEPTPPTELDPETDPETDPVPEPTEVSLGLFAVVDGEYVKVNTIYEPGYQGDGGSDFPDTGDYIILAFDAQGNILPNQPGGTVSVTVGAAGDSAQRGSDYEAPGAVNATVGQVFNITATDDGLSDNGENFSLTLNQDWDNPSGFDVVNYGNINVNTTILDETDNDPATPGDNDSAFTLKLFASDDQGNVLLDGNGDPITATEIHEDSNNGDTTAYYVVKAVDDQGDLLADQPGGTVDVTFTNDSTEDSDYTYGNTNVAVGQAFSATSVDDALADNGEDFVVSLNNGSYSEDAANTADGSGQYETVTYAPDTVTTTILDETDNDPTTPGDNDNAFTLKLFPSDADGNIVTDASVIHEDSGNGSTTAYYVVKAVDEEGNPLINQPEGMVDVTFTNGSAESGDYTYGNTNVTVGQAFSATSVDDALSDNGENFVVSLNEGSFSDAGSYETVTYAPDTVTTTILDETNTSTPNDNDSAFTLKLFASDDQGNVLLDGNGDPITATEIHEDSNNDDTTAYYVVKAVDARGNPLPNQPKGTVDVTFTNDSTEDSDYTYGNTNVTVGQAFSAT
ncbi:hypothetical protein SAMN04489856_1192, partial [Oleiphilus messinensis]